MCTASSCSTSSGEPAERRRPTSNPALCADHLVPRSCEFAHWPVADSASSPVWPAHNPAVIRVIEDQITTLRPYNARYTGDHRSNFRERYGEMITRVSFVRRGPGVARYSREHHAEESICSTWGDTLDLPDGRLGRRAALCMTFQARLIVRLLVNGPTGPLPRENFL
jgi:hypothetical protein